MTFMAAAAPVPADLLDRYYTRILGLAYQVLGDAALAARAAETVFDRIVKDEATDGLEIWRAAVGVLRSYLLRGFTVEPLASDAAGWQASLVDGLAALDPEERILLILRYHEGLRHEQLAQILGQDTRHVREEVARARGRLMDVLGLRDALH